MKSYETNRALKKLSMILFFLITTLCYAINSSSNVICKMIILITWILSLVKGIAIDGKNYDF